MKSWLFDKLCCISANKEQMVFERGSQKVTMEYNPNILPNIIPLGSYDFELTENEKGNYKIASFNAQLRISSIFVNETLFATR